MPRPDIDGLGLLSTPMAMAEFLRDTERLAMRPRARMAFPVFWISGSRSSRRSSRSSRSRVKIFGSSEHEAFTNLPLASNDELLQLIRADLVVAETIVWSLAQPLGLQALLGGQAVLLSVDQ